MESDQSFKIILMYTDHPYTSCLTSENVTEDEKVKYFTHKTFSQK